MLQASCECFTDTIFRHGLGKCFSNHAYYKYKLLLFSLKFPHLFCFRKVSFTMNDKWKNFEEYSVLLISSGSLSPGRIKVPCVRDLCLRTVAYLIALMHAEYRDRADTLRRGGGGGANKWLNVVGLKTLFLSNSIIFKKVVGGGGGWSGPWDIDDFIR